MCIANNIDLQMSAETMHQYVAGSAALKTMIHLLFDELDRGDK